MDRTVLEIKECAAAAGIGRNAKERNFAGLDFSAQIPKEMAKKIEENTLVYFFLQIYVSLKKYICQSAQIAKEMVKNKGEYFCIFLSKIFIYQFGEIYLPICTNGKRNDEKK